MHKNGKIIKRQTMKLKSMIKRIFYDELKTLKLSVSQKVYSEKIFEDLIWTEIEKLIERGKYD